MTPESRRFPQPRHTSAFAAGESGRAFRVVPVIRPRYEPPAGVGIQVSELGSWAAFGSLGAALLLAFLALRSPPKNWLLEYYRNPRLEGPATRAWIRRANFGVPDDSLLTGVPEREDFSLRLQSCLVLPQAGQLVFRLKADDQARLSVDGKLLLQAEAKQGGKEKAAVELEPGSHTLGIEYANARGAAELHLDVQQPGTRGFRSVQALTRRPSLSGQCDAD